MKNQETLEKLVTSALVTAANIPAAKVSADSWLMGELELESIDLLELNFELEQVSGVEINFLEIIAAAQKKTGSEKRDMRVSDIVEYLAKRKNG